MPRSLTVKRIEGGKPGKVYYPLQLVDRPKVKPGPNELLVRMCAAALNHRDLFIRQHLYPGISFEHPMLADGYGIVVEASPGSTRGAQLLGKPVLLTPARGWESDPAGPEDGGRRYSVIGATAMYDAGTALEYAVVAEDEVERAPEHLSAAEGAALPLAGLTAWRALVTKSGAAAAGQNVLVTGIGGGVALMVLQFAVAFGCNVFVTSGDEAKIARAKKLGARGGVLYKAVDWEKQLQAMLPADRPFLDAVVDGAGDDVVARTVKLLKPGGVISIYGMTLGPKMDWSMQAVLKNIDLRGSTMGSKKEFRDMVKFVREKEIRPVVSRVVKGLDNLQGIDGLFEDMKAGKQFGKLVIEIDEIDSKSSEYPSKL